MAAAADEPACSWSERAYGGSGSGTTVVVQQDGGHMDTEWRREPKHSTTFYYYTLWTRDGRTGDGDERTTMQTALRRTRNAHGHSALGAHDPGPHKPRLSGNPQCRQSRRQVSACRWCAAAVVPRPSPVRQPWPFDYYGGIFPAKTTRTRPPLGRRRHVGNASFHIDIGSRARNAVGQQPAPCCRCPIL